MSFPGNTSSNPHNRGSQGRQSSYQGRQNSYQGGPQENTGHATRSEPRPNAQHFDTAPPGTNPGTQSPNPQRMESDSRRTNTAMEGNIEALFEQMSETRNQYREQQEQQQAPVAGPPEFKPKVSLATVYIQEFWFPPLVRAALYEWISETRIQTVAIGSGIFLKGNALGQAIALWAVITMGLMIANEGSNAHLNPEFTLTCALFRGFASYAGKLTTLLWGVVYVLAQLLGGVWGAGIVRGIWADEFAAAAKMGTKELGSATPGSRLAMLVPVDGHNAKSDVWAEVLCCAFVALVICWNSDKSHKVFPVMCVRLSLEALTPSLFSLRALDRCLST